MIVDLCEVKGWVQCSIISVLQYTNLSWGYKMILNNVRKLLPHEYNSIFIRFFSNNVINMEKLEREIIQEEYITQQSTF